MKKKFYGKSPKFFRLTVGKEVRLKALIYKSESVLKDINDITE